MQAPKLFKTFLLLLCTTALFAACQDPESDLGINLQDPATRYHGKNITFDVEASTFYEDSLQTSGAPTPYSAAIVGNYSDITFGKVSATLFSQIRVPNEGGINLDPATTRIDSVVLSFVVLDWFPATPDSSNTFHLQVEVRQLSETLLSDSNYYATDDIPANGSLFFDGNITCSEKDTLIRIKLNASANELFFASMSSEEFLEHAKGIRVRFKSGSDPCMPSVNLAAAGSKLRVHYTYEGDTVSNDFLCGTGTNHFTKIEHNYSGTLMNRFVTNKKDSIPGNQYLYLEPLGGTKVGYDINKFIDTFRVAHPYAIIHHAELILPKASIADDNPPTRILAYKRASGGYEAPIPDLLGEYFGSYGRGFDGSYHKSDNCYHLRITQHLQKLLRTGHDYGTTLYIDARRSSARRTIINGSNQTDRIRINIIYSEADYQ